jgi:nicotinamidase-related amidase
VLVVVDVQEKLVPAIPDHDAVIDRTGRLIDAAKRLDIPVAASEQYPRGLGHTVEPLRERLAPGARIEKNTFDALRASEVRRWLEATRRDQIVLVGTEAHVCVLQTAFGGMGHGYAAFVVADAVGSRAAENRELALARLRAGGAGIVSTEMVIFEWLERAGTDAFREVVRLVR